MVARFQSSPFNRCLVLATLALCLLGIGRLSFQSRSMESWEHDLRTTLWEDSRYSHVFPEIDGRTVRLRGDLADVQFLVALPEIVEETFPLVAKIDFSEVHLAMQEPWLRIEQRDGVIRVAGELSDPGLRLEILHLAGGLGEVRELEDELHFNPEVRFAGWGAEIVQFLPKMRGLETFRVEIRDRTWVLAGEVSDTMDRRDLAMAWEALVPPDAVMDVTGLKDADLIPVHGLRFPEPFRIETGLQTVSRDLWRAYEEAR